MPIYSEPRSVKCYNENRSLLDLLHRIVCIFVYLDIHRAIFRIYTNTQKSLFFSLGKFIISMQVINHVYCFCNNLFNHIISYTQYWRISKLFTFCYFFVILNILSQVFIFKLSFGYLQTGISLSLSLLNMCMQYKVLEVYATCRNICLWLCPSCTPQTQVKISFQIVNFFQDQISFLCILEAQLTFSVLYSYLAASQ